MSLDNINRTNGVLSTFAYSPTTREVSQKTVAGGSSELPVSAVCDWEDCKFQAKYCIDLHIDDAKPELCDSHMTFIFLSTGNGCKDE